MASTTALAGVGIGSSIAGGIIAAQGAEQTGAAQQQMFNYQAGVAKINAQIDQQNADWALSQGDIQAREYGQSAAQRKGAIIAAQGASNIQVGSGSNAEVQRSQALVTSLDMAQIRNNAAKTAYDFQTKSVMDVNQASLDVMAGQNAKLAGDINATSSIIGSVGSVSSKWLAASQAGVPGFGGGGSGSIDLYGPDFTKTGNA